MYFLQVENEAFSGAGAFFAFFILLIAYVVLCNQPANAARKYGQNVTATFLVSFLLTPATGFLMVIANKEPEIKIVERVERVEEVEKV